MPRPYRRFGGCILRALCGQKLAAIKVSGAFHGEYPSLRGMGIGKGGDHGQ